MARAPGICTHSTQMSPADVHGCRPSDAERFDPPAVRVPVTSAEIVYVSVDENRRPTPIQTALNP